LLFRETLHEIYQSLGLGCIGDYFILKIMIINQSVIYKYFPKDLSI